MKKNALTLFIAIFLLISSSSFAGIVDVRFTNGSFTGNSYCATVQVKAQDIDFELGSATVFFNYNQKALKNPTFNSLNFNEKNTCDMGEAAYSNSFNFLETGETTGEGNYAIILKQANKGCPTVTQEWISVAEFCFDVVDATKKTGLGINTKYTAFNTVDNTGAQHSIGEVSGLENSVTSTRDVVQTNTTINIYPNLTQDLVNIGFEVKKAGDINITIYDMLGRVIAIQNDEFGLGQQNVQLNIANYANGYYLIEVDNGVEKLTDKILLAR